MWQILFLVKLQAFSYKYESFTINDNDGFCAGVCFGKSLGFILIDNGQGYNGFYGEVLPGLRLWRNLFKQSFRPFLQMTVTESLLELVLIKLQVFTVGSVGVFCQILF